MSVNYSLNLTGIKAQGQLIMAYYTKVGTNSVTGKTGKFSGCVSLTLDSFNGVTPSLESTKSLVEQFINDNILSSVNQKILDQINS